MDDRYIRQKPVIGLNGQKKLIDTNILIIGCGGIGSPVALYLISSGIGNITIVDDDFIEISNIHRQILFREKDIGHLKTKIAQERLKEINTESNINIISRRLDLNLALDIFHKFDLIIDGSDNYCTKYLINDVCSKLRKSFISCSISKDTIQIALFDTVKSCYRCFYPEPPPLDMTLNCLNNGIVGAVAGIAGTITANLAINHLLNRYSKVGEFLIFNTLDLVIDKIQLFKNNDCSACVHNKIQFKSKQNEIGLFQEELNQLKDYLLIDVREKDERIHTKLNDDIHIPANNFKELFNLPKNKTLVLYCNSDIRSQQLANILRNKGYLAYFLKGGVMGKKVNAF